MILFVSTSQIEAVTLLNSENYWLRYQNNRKAWGFMYDNEENFQKFHPTIWHEILQKDMEDIETEDEIITFGSI